MPAFDFTNRTAQFAAEGLGGSALADGSGNGNFLEDNLSVPGGFTGHVASDGGRARGLLRSGDRHFQDGASSPNIAWDLRTTGTPGGLVSCTWTGWVWVDNLTQGYIFSIHNPTSAAGQAFHVYAGTGLGGGEISPGVAVFDGLSSFNRRHVKINNDLEIATSTWQFVAGGWNAATNKIFGFWGVQPGEHYYNEADGFAAGFQYTELNRTKIGFWNAVGGQARIAVDHMLWFKNRVLTEAELEIIWANHVGIDFNALSGSTGGDSSAQWYWKRKRGLILP